MNFINVDTNVIKWSWHTPDCEYPWVPLADVDMSAVTVPSTQIVTGQLECSVMPIDTWVIENFVARALTRDELEDFDAAKARRIEDAKVYGRRLVCAKVLDLSDEMGSNNDVENVLWMMLTTAHVSDLDVLKSYCDTVYGAVLSKIQEFNACATWDELDTVTIP